MPSGNIQNKERRPGCLSRAAISAEKNSNISPTSTAVAVEKIRPNSIRLMAVPSSSGMGMAISSRRQATTEMMPSKAA